MQQDLRPIDWGANPEDVQGLLVQLREACHELNQPIQILSCYLEMLLLKMSEADSNYATLSQMHEQVERLRTMARELNLLLGQGRTGSEQPLQAKNSSSGSEQ